MLFVFYAFILISIIQLIFYLGVFGTFAFAKNPKKNNNTLNIPVSVIICAHNEEENLNEFLPSFINQTHPHFELILINDASTDNTLEVMQSFQKKHPDKIKIVNISLDKKKFGNKKHALTLGINAAKNEYLLFSDADCKPISKDWISEMAAHFSEKKDIILGYGAYAKINNSWLDKLIRFETLFTAIQYFSYAKIGLPYMGVGRNLAYKKSLFSNNKGFANHKQLKSGDDDLFINANATNQNIACSLYNDSFTVSKPKTTFKDWILQKRRHISTANHYKPIHQFLLGLFYFTQISFWVLSILLIILGFQLQTVVIILLLRISIYYLIIGITAQKLNEKDVIIWSPLLEIFLILIQLSIFIKNLVSKPTHW